MCVNVYDDRNKRKWYGQIDTLYKTVEHRDSEF